MTKIFIYTLKYEYSITFLQVLTHFNFNIAEC
ncbi:hypothetical protein C7972_12058 [Arenibacter sp. ARW7G5Y1]|nr:hypothetical protein C7972_12058 [Arenibacter sp. ARW7G5Y1]